MPSKMQLIFGDWRLGRILILILLSQCFLLINEFIAYIIGITIYILGLLGLGYLTRIICIIAIGLPLNLPFIFKSTPRVARIVNVLSLVILGSLFVIGMSIGRI